MTTNPMTMTPEQHRAIVAMFFGNIIDACKTHESWKKSDATGLLIGAVDEVINKMSPDQWTLLKKDLTDRYVGR